MSPEKKKEDILTINDISGKLKNGMAKFVLIHFNYMILIVFCFSKSFIIFNLKTKYIDIIRYFYNYYPVVNRQLSKIVNLYRNYFKTYSYNDF